MIVFLTVYLGLIAGRRPFEVRADPAVAAVRFLLDGNEVAAIAQPPWKASVDLGAAIEPHEIVAVGLDANGKEITRAAQVLNLPRPAAEVEIVLDKSSVTLQARHISYARPKSASASIDAVPLALDSHFAAALPPLDMKRPHVVSAEMTFADGTVARREIVFGGEFSDAVPAELTPAAIVRIGADQTPPAADCFAMRVNSVEKTGALLVIVRDPLPAEIRRALKVPVSVSPVVRRSALTVATMELLSPVAERIRAADQPTALMFPHLANRDPRIGLYWFVTSALVPGAMKEPRQWADAVAVAAVHAASSGSRRAVILLLGSAPDASRSSPAAVRRYLDAVGVPLFVWSVTGPRPDLADVWGAVEDVSTKEKIEHATAVVNGFLEAQRIAWLYADPLTAVHARVKDGCGWASLAR